MKTKTIIFLIVLALFSSILGGTVLVKSYSNKKKQLEEHIWAAKMAPLMKMMISCEDKECTGKLDCEYNNGKVKCEDGNNAEQLNATNTH